MEPVDIGYAKAFIFDEHIVVLEVNTGVTVDKVKAEHFYDVIEPYFDSDYSLVINRKNKYQLLRFEVFNVINNRNRLKGVAIVVNRASARQMAAIERPLSRKPFASFSNLGDAIDWVKALHRQ